MNAIKLCVRCSQEKNIKEFGKNAGKRDGLQTYCKPCTIEYIRKYREKNPDLNRDYYNKYKDRILADQKSYYQENREHILQRTANYRLKNQDKIEAWREKNKERLLEWAKEYRTVNRDLILERRRSIYRSGEKERNRTREYRARKTTQLGFLPDGYEGILEEAYGKFCMKCERAENIHLDHIVPVSKGGMHCITNMQWLCAHCNTSKGNRESIDYRPFQIEEFLLELN